MWGSPFRVSCFSFNPPFPTDEDFGCCICDRSFGSFVLYILPPSIYYYYYDYAYYYYYLMHIHEHKWCMFFIAGNKMMVNLFKFLTIVAILVTLIYGRTELMMEFLMYPILIQVLLARVTNAPIIYGHYSNHHARQIFYFFNSWAMSWYFSCSLLLLCLKSEFFFFFFGWSRLYETQTLINFVFSKNLCFVLLLSVYMVEPK